MMQLQILEKEDCEKLNMGCYLAVAACSAEPPKFIHLTYKPKGAPMILQKMRVGWHCLGTHALLLFEQPLVRCSACCLVQIAVHAWVQTPSGVWPHA